MKKLFALFILFSALAFAQGWNSSVTTASRVTKNDAQQNVWANYTNTNRITALLKDSIYLWIGTSGGLIKYNITTGEQYLINKSTTGFPGTFITSLKLKNDILWVGTKNGGFGKFDGQNWSSFNPENSDLPIDYISALDTHNQIVWLSTKGGGLVKLNNGNITVYNSLNSGLPNNYINCLGIENDGDVWMGPSNRDLVWFNGGWGTYSAGPYNHNVTALTIDNHNYIWLTNSHFLTVYNLNNYNDQENIQFPQPQIINTISIDSNNHKWLGSRDNGILMLLDSTNWFIYNKENSGLPDNDVRAIEVDGQSKWIGTFNGGLAKFNGSDWQILNTNTSAPFLSGVNSFFIDNNDNKWIGFRGDGIWKFDNKIWTNLNTDNSALSDNYIMSVIQDNSNNLWIGTYYGGLNKYDGNGWINFNTSNSGLSDSNVVSVKKDNEENLWIATWGGGLDKFDGVSWTVFNSSNSDLTDDYIYVMFIDHSDNIWLGTFGSGLFKFNGIEWQTFNTGNSSIPGNFITDIQQDRENNLWIGTWADGVVRYDYNEFKLFSNSNTSFPVDEIGCISIDDSDNVYLGTRNSGLIKFSANDTLVESWKLYNKYNSGLIDNEITAIGNDNEGNIWIGSEGGITVFNPAGVVGIKNELIYDNPEEYSLYQNYPNPFNPATTITYQTPQSGLVILKVYDILGKEIATLVNEQKLRGKYSVSFNASGLASGVYIYRIQVNDYVRSKKMLMIK